MNLNENQRKEMLEKAKPLIKWMVDNCHPHCECIVNQTDITLVEGVARNQTFEFLKYDEKSNIRY